jgi:WD40 repeat protein
VTLVSIQAKTAPLKLFVSYSHTDAGALAGRLADDLRARGFDVWLDLDRSKPGASWTRGIEVGIDQAHVVLTLLSKGSFISNICRAEQLRALRKKKRVLPILVQEDADVPIHLEFEQYLRFYDGRYQDKLQQLQKAIGDDTITALLQKNYKSHYRTYPPLPQHFVPRPELLARLRQEIIKEGDGTNVPLIAIRGMGGIGKTVLAQAVCHDEAIQDAFPDGVLWISIGNNPSSKHLYEQIREVAKALGDTLASYDTLQGCQNQLRNTLRDKSVLMVLDDVWDPNHIQPFNAEARRCRLLFTTRNQAVVSGANAREVTVTLMDESESRELLARKSSLKVETLPAEATRIIQRCGGLPLALSMMGARARKSGKEWTRIVDALELGGAERVSLKLSDYRYAGLFETTQVSVDSLTREQQLRYLDLAVFPSSSIPEKVLETLWGTTENDISEIIESWVEASLANYQHGLVVLHDLQLDYVRKQSEDLGSLHRRLLRAYKSKFSGGWSKGPDDGYYFSHLTYHMLGAGYTRELRQLLLSADWIRTKLEKKGISALLEDYESSPSDPITLLIQRALQLSAHVLARDPGQVASQMLGRLRSIKFAEIQEFIVEMQNTQKHPWLEPLSQSLWQPGAVLVCTLAGHTGAVKAVAIEPDGKRALTASDDHTLKLWNLETGAEVLTLRGHMAPVNAVVLAHKTLAVSASYDRTMKLWNLENGNEIRTLAGDSHLVNALALANDGRHLVSASYARQLKVWDIATGEELYSLIGHSGWVNAVAITHDGKQVVSASQDYTLNIWDLESGRLLCILAGHSGSVNDVAITPDNSQIVSASSDKTIRVWNLETGAHMRTLVGHTGGVSRVIITDDGEQAISASQDNTIRVWDLKTGKQRHILAGHMGSVHTVLLIRNSLRAISGSDDKSLKVWDLERGTELDSLGAHSGPVNAVAATSDGRRVVSVSGMEGATLKVWDFESGFDIHRVVRHEQMVNAVAISSNGKLVISASCDSTLRVRELESDAQIHTLIGHSKAVNCVVITGDGMRAVSASSDHTIKVWDLIKGAEIHTLVGHSRTVDHVAVTSDGKWAVSAAFDRTLKLWDIVRGMEIRTLTGHSAWVRHVLITQDGSRAVSASYDRTVRIWDLQSGISLHTLTGHQSWINAVAITRAPELVVSASYDHTLKVWDLETGAQRHTLAGHSGPVSAVAITPDGKQAVSASHDHTLKVWDLETGAQLHTLIGHTRSVNAVAVFGKHEYVVSASNDNTVKLWTMNGKEIATFSADGPVVCLTVRGDDRTLVAGDYLGGVHLMRVREPGRQSGPNHSKY